MGTTENQSEADGVSGRLFDDSDVVRQALRREIVALQQTSEELTAAKLKVLSNDLAKEIREDFLGQVKTVGWVLAIVATVATAGGLFSLSDLITRRIDVAVAAREADVAKLRENVIGAVVAFQQDAKKALSDIELARTQVTEESQKARLVIRARLETADAQAPESSEDDLEALNDNRVVTIRTVVHVVYQTKEQNIPDVQIRSQIDALNRDFRARNQDLTKVPSAFKALVGDARIEFKLADRDPMGAPSSGMTRWQTNQASFELGDKVKSRSEGGTDPWSTDKYLNIWVANVTGGILGYSQLPGGPASTDGVVMSYKAFGTLGTVSSPFNLGRSATHQIGQYLNLRHIWGDTPDCGGSDFVADTPNAAGPNFGSPTFPVVTCNNGPNGDMFMNSWTT